MYYKNNHECYTFDRIVSIMKILNNFKEMKYPCEYNSNFDSIFINSYSLVSSSENAQQGEGRNI